MARFPALLTSLWRRPSADVLTREAELALQAGDPDTAETLLARAVKRDPGFGPAHFLRGRIAMGAGRRADALVSAWRAWTAQPDEVRYYDTLWRLVNAIRTDDLDGAKLAPAPADYLTAIARGNTARRAGQTGAAGAAFEDAVALDPTLPFAYSRLGCLRAALDAPVEADRAFRDAVARRPHREACILLDPDRLDPVLARAYPEAAFEDLPSFETVGEVVLVACDEAYLMRFGRQFIRSFVRNAGEDVGLHVHVINPGASARRLREDMRAEVGGRLPVAITFEHTGAGGSPTYCACARFLVLPALLVAYGKPVVAMDIDMVFTGPLADVTGPVQSADVALFTQDPQAVDLWDAYRAACVRVAPTQAGRLFARQVRRYIIHCLEHNLAFWYLDQIALFAVLSYGRMRQQAPPVVATFDPVRLLDGEAAKVTEETRLWSITASLPTAEARMSADLFRGYSDNEAL